MKVKEKLSQQIDAFISRRAKGRMEQMRLMVFLVGAAMVLIGMPLHFLFGWVGYDDLVLRGISMAIWLAALAVVWLYVAKRLKLDAALLDLSVSYQLLTSFRILYLALSATPNTVPLYHELVILNEALSLTNFLVVCMGMVRNAPTAVLALFLIPLGAAYIINPGVVASQFVLFFILVTVCIWAYAITMRVLFSNATKEIDDYKRLQASILDMFNMSKVEMLSLVNLCRSTGHSKDVDRKMVGKLSEQTRHNLISLGEHLSNERRDKVTDMADILPQMTATEQEVCRLVLKGMTQSEIAEALDKSMSNIGTVRGNIRKKLGLSPDDDLRATLLAMVNESKTIHTTPPDAPGGQSKGTRHRLSRAAS